MTRQQRGSEHYFAEHPTSEAKLGIVRTYLRGVHFEFLTASSVFSKRKVDIGTRLLIESMVLPDEGCVLDVGCGYGPVGIAAAAFKPRLHVMMTDVNVRAVQLARENIQRNKITNAEVRHGCLYEPVEGLTFNCVLSNPPVSAGMEIVKAIVRNARKIMANPATFQIVIRSKIGAKNLPDFLTETFGNCRVLARESGYRVFISEKR